MIVALIHDFLFPFRDYGGTERVVWWLGKGLAELGVKVVLVCKPGSSCPFAEIFPWDLTSDIEMLLPQVSVFHHFNTPSEIPTRPYVVTIGGNGKKGETYLSNTVFVSRNHAERHGGECFVYNGLDPYEYQFSEKKEDYLVFLAKASWNVKNVDGAIRVAKRAGMPLHIMGGKKFFFNHRGQIHWEGMVAGGPKASLLSKARGLIFPVIWDEPFGIAVVEALVSGTPVLATPYGSLPELVPSEVGRLCDSEDAFLNAISTLHEIRPEDCREWALEKFHYRRMAKNYLNLYERVLKGERLNRQDPIATGAQEKLYPIPRHTS